MVIILLQELQSSELPGPKIRAGGRPPTMSLLGFRRCSDIITLTFSQSRRHWYMIVLSIIERHRAQSVADSSWRKNREKDATDSRKKRLCYHLQMSCMFVIFPPVEFSRQYFQMLRCGDRPASNQSSCLLCHDQKSWRFCYQPSLAWRLIVPFSPS
jgi:hypothetical protein